MKSYENNQRFQHNYRQNMSSKIDPLMIPRETIQYLVSVDRPAREFLYLEPPQGRETWH